MRLLILFACAGMMVLFGAENRFRIHANSRLEIRGLAGGTEGWVWIAARDGLWRFDGFHYQRIPGLPFATATHVVTTKDGAVWVGAPEGLARMDTAGRFSKIRSETVLGLAAGADEVFLRTPAGLWRLPMDGTGADATRIEPPGGQQLTVDAAGALWYAQGGAAYRLERGERRASRMGTVPEGLAGPAEPQVAAEGNGRLWFATREWAMTEDGGTRLRRDVLPDTPASLPLLLRGRSHLWALPRALQRLDGGAPRSWDYLPSVPSAAPAQTGFEDPRGRLWTDLPGTGLMVAIADAGWQRWRNNFFKGKSVVEVWRGASGMHAATYRNEEGRLWRLSPAMRWEAIGSDQRDFDHVLELEDGTFLASAGLARLEHLDAQGKSIQRIRHPATERDRFREIVRDRNGQIWVAHEDGLFRAARDSRGAFGLEPEPLPMPRPDLKARVTDLEVDAQGRLWAGFIGGLAFRDAKGQWQVLATSHPVQRVMSFALAGGDADPAAEIWVAHHLDGGLARLRRRPDQAVWDVEDLTEDTGYAPAAVSFVKRDRRGWIWCGTANGVRVSDGIHVRPQDWLRLTLNEGLDGVSMNKYGYFEDSDGSIWLAGLEGVTHVRPEAAWFGIPAEAPRVTRVEVGGQTVYLGFGALPEEIPEGAGTMRLEVGSVQVPDFRDRPLVYRVLPGREDWRPAEGGTIDLPFLGRRIYEVEVAWSAPRPVAALRYGFRVGPEGLGTRVAPWLLLLGSLAGVLRLTWNRVWMQRWRYRLERAWSRRVRSAAGERRREPAEWEEGLLDGRYRPVRILSKGGFSSVYEGRDEASGQPVAIKRYNHRAAEFNWVRDRFAHEVAALGMIRHPGVLALLDSWVQPDGTPVLVMPLVQGESLRERMRRGPIGAEDAALLIRALGEALGEIHSRGVIHRDLKPENILMREGDARGPLLIDFGNSGLLGAGERMGTTKVLTGTIDYMAPEQVMYHYAAASDLYSLAIVILEVLTGRKLSELGGYEPSAAFTGEMQRLLAEAGHTQAEWLAQELAAVLVPDPARRPAGAAAWARGFAAALGEAKEDCGASS